MNKIDYFSSFYIQGVIVHNRHSAQVRDVGHKEVVEEFQTQPAKVLVLKLLLHVVLGTSPFI